MAQFNIRLDDKTVTALDTLAAKQGIDRPELVRRMVAETLNADEQGRALFDRSHDFDPRELTGVVRRVNEGLTEFDRKLSDIAKREAEIVRTRRDDADRMSEARTEFMDALPERLTQAYVPFRKDLDQLKTAFTEHPRLAAIDNRLERVEKLAGDLRPNVFNQLNGVNLSWPALFLAGVIGFLLSVTVFFGLGFVFPQWVGLPAANRLLGGGDQAVCALINFRTGTERCVATIDGSGMRVRIVADPGTRHK